MFQRKLNQVVTTGIRDAVPDRSWAWRQLGAAEGSAALSLQRLVRIGLKVPTGGNRYIGNHS
jgi:hypothetical protein